MHLPAILGDWGAPPDRPAWGAVALAGAAILFALAPASETRRLAQTVGSGRFAALLAFAAALLSLGYVAFYLRGGPRIIDATSYFLQARALSEGHFAWHVPEPSASFRGRFLLFHEGEIAGIFPPGYPLLLSLGFAVGAPLVVGPLLAAAIVIATWALARELAHEAGLDARDAASVARIAACLSVVCATLRYHTADTMAHGACALAFALSLLAALRARAERLPWFFLLAGLGLGFVVATRFASAVALGAVVGWLAVGSDRRKTALVACLLGAIPGLLLLLIAQSTETGHLLGSTQQAYYAASDGPPGCFRYGFGAGIGCLVEHGDFVRARASDGYGMISALGVTARRLRMHVEDVANLEPLALLVLAPLAWPRWRTPGVRASLALVGALMVAYAPFYFDGDYPGGGARFFADALPIEHALAALGVAAIAASRPRSVSTRRLGAVVLALACGGFAVHGAYAHEQLRLRDGANPMFDPEVIADRALGVPPADGSPPPATLLFFETDHGFDLAHDPGTAEHAALALARGEKPSGLVVARLRNDDHDRALYEHLGHPQAWVYRFVPETPKTVADLVARGHEAAAGSLQPWSPLPGWTAGAETWRFESESEWPPLAQTGGAWVEPIWVTDTCASPTGAGRALALHTSRSDGGSVVLGLPVPRPGSWRVTTRFLRKGRGSGVALAILGADGAPLASWTEAEVAADGEGTADGPGDKDARCVDLAPRVITVPASTELRLVLRAAAALPDDAVHLTAIDRILLAPSPR